MNSDLVNTLTGAILGVPEQKVPQALSLPQQQYRGQLICSLLLGYLVYELYETKGDNGSFILAIIVI